jgi:hypothetical protein
LNISKYMDDMTWRKSNFVAKIDVYHPYLS